MHRDWPRSALACDRLHPATMDLPAFSAYDAKEPQAFYLGPDPEFTLLADATMFGQGSCGQLPVHSHIVSMHSRVLKTLFAAVREGGAVSSAVGGVLRPGPSGLVLYLSCPLLHPLAGSRRCVAEGMLHWLLRVRGGRPAAVHVPT